MLTIFVDEIFTPTSNFLNPWHGQHDNKQYTRGAQSLVESLFIKIARIRPYISVSKQKNEEENDLCGKWGFINFPVIVRKSIQLFPKFILDIWLNLNVNQELDNLCHTIKYLLRRVSQHLISKPNLLAHWLRIISSTPHISGVRILCKWKNNIVKWRIFRWIEYGFTIS